ncbi:UNVERIFIED_CONTAM: hypothetical protein K2H54_026800 [Gekko kuhli]
MCGEMLSLRAASMDRARSATLISCSLRKAAALAILLFLLSLGDAVGQEPSVQHHGNKRPAPEGRRLLFIGGRGRNMNSCLDSSFLPAHPIHESRGDCKVTFVDECGCLQQCKLALEAERANLTLDPAARNKKKILSYYTLRDNDPPLLPSSIFMNFCGYHRF